jgi:hypothetical protein
MSVHEDNLFPPPWRLSDRAWLRIKRAVVAACLFVIAALVCSGAGGCL